MGLAASQARFLGITLRKANLEFRSTELAQQKLELTDQMSLISQDYSNALNATKLTWSNEACNGDFGLTYGLLMTPSAANNYNPYMVSTKSGAIVLDTKFQSAAIAAGISMAGSIPSADGYEKFIRALGDGCTNTPGERAIGADGKPIVGQGLITRTTQQTILTANNWHSTAGLGAIPKDKNTIGQSTLSDLLADKNYGGVGLDWLQVLREAMGYSYNEMSTTGCYDEQTKIYDEQIAKSLNPIRPILHIWGYDYTSEFLQSVSKDLYDEQGNISCKGIMLEFDNIIKALEESSPGTAQRLLYEQKLEYLKQGKDENGQPLKGSTAYNAHNSTFTVDNDVVYPLCYALYQKARYLESLGGGARTLTWASDEKAKPVETGGYSIGISQMFNTFDGYVGHPDGDKYGFKDYLVNYKGDSESTRPMLNMTMFVNGIVENSGSHIQSMTLADLLTNDIVIMAQSRNDDHDSAGVTLNDATNTVRTAGRGMLDYIARIFGYDHMGTGLNMDESTDRALKEAYSMTQKKFLGGTASAGNMASDSCPKENSAYVNANTHNCIGVMDGGNEIYAALNLSNMVSAFLTYYDNALRGGQSEYIVGRGNDTSDYGEDKTYFVTDDPSYIYITNVRNPYTNEEKFNDFYSELYNNICEHGWRYDGNLDDYEYLENTIKDGRYSLMSLYSDGYYYQSKYNDIEYIIEEVDKDALTRAEAEFMRKKAEITNKEDIIDIKTKKLDAEIAELTTELNSVQNIISKSIEKTFSLFSS